MLLGNVTVQKEWGETEVMQLERERSKERGGEWRNKLKSYSGTSNIKVIFYSL